MLKRIFAIMLTILTMTTLMSCTNESETQSDTVTDTTTLETPAVSDAIFVDGENGNDENDALTADTAVATYEKAFELLTAERNRIVIVRSVRAAYSYSMPKYDGQVVFTTLHDGVDYNEQNNAALRIGYEFSLNCDAVLENVHIRATADKS